MDNDFKSIETGINAFNSWAADVAANKSKGVLRLVGSGNEKRIEYVSFSKMDTKEWIKEKIYHCFRGGVTNLHTIIEFAAKKNITLENRVKTTLSTKITNYEKHHSQGIQATWKKLFESDKEKNWFTEAKIGEYQLDCNHLKIKVNDSKEESVEIKKSITFKDRYRIIKDGELSPLAYTEIQIAKIKCLQFDMPAGYRASGISKEFEKHYGFPLLANNDEKQGKYWTIGEDGKLVPILTFLEQMDTASDGDGEAKKILDPLKAMFYSSHQHEQDELKELTTTSNFLTSSKIGDCRVNSAKDTLQVKISNSEEKRIPILKSKLDGRFHILIKENQASRLAFTPKQIARIRCFQQKFLEDSNITKSGASAFLENSYGIPLFKNNNNEYLTIGTDGNLVPFAEFIKEYPEKNEKNNLTIIHENLHNIKKSQEKIEEQQKANFHIRESSQFPGRFRFLVGNKESTLAFTKKQLDAMNSSENVSDKKGLKKIDLSSQPHIQSTGICLFTKKVNNKNEILIINKEGNFVSIWSGTDNSFETSINKFFSNKKLTSLDLQVFFEALCDQKIIIDNKNEIKNVYDDTNFEIYTSPKKYDN